MLDGVGLIGDGSVADLLWAGPSATVIGIDVPAVIGSAAALQASRPRASACGCRPAWTGQERRTRSSRTCGRACRGACAARSSGSRSGDPFVGSLDGPAFEALKAALEQAYGRAMTTEGQGGSIPLCNVLAETYPDAEILLMGVEEPGA